MDPTWLAAALLLGAAIYWHFTKTFNYWKNKGVPYLTPTVFFGNIKERLLLRISAHEFYLHVYEKLAKHEVGGYFEGRQPILLVRDPQLIRDVMVRYFEHFTDRPTLETRRKPHIKKILLDLKGQNWKNVRALLTPTFSTGKIRLMQVLVQLSGEQLRDFLHSSIPVDGGKELEMKDLFGRFTMDVIASCAFGVNCNSLKNPDAEFARYAARFVDISTTKRLILFVVLFILPSNFLKYISLTIYNNEVLDFLVAVVQDTLQTRKKSTDTKRNDFIQLMIDTAQKEAESNSKGNGVLDEDTIIAQALFILLAGFDTSSTLLTFACYELALNPDIQHKVREEVKSVLSHHHGKCSYEALQEMNYLENVLLETLRKHPPVACLDRVCTAKCNLEKKENVITVDTGDHIIVSIMGLHYDPQYFPEPHKFDPDRFSPENRIKRSPYAFLPFGEGPRNCIGRRFALLSTKLAMVYFLRDFCVQPSPKTKIPYKYSRSSHLLLAKDGIYLNVQRIDTES